MTKKLSSKMQAKHLKKRSQRAAKKSAPKTETAQARIRRERLDRYTNGAVAGLLARGQVINGRELSIDEVMKMINHTIEVNAGVGSVAETMEILEREGKLVISEELRATIDQFDEDVVKFNENAQTISIVLQGENNLLGLPPELLMDTGFRSERLVTEICPKIMAEATPFTELVNTYQKEHYPQQDYRKVMFNVALTRLARITPKYATPANVDAEEVLGDEAVEAHAVLNDKEEA